MVSLRKEQTVKSTRASLKSKRTDPGYFSFLPPPPAPGELDLTNQTGIDTMAASGLLPGCFSAASQLRLLLLRLRGKRRQKQPNCLSRAR